MRTEILAAVILLLALPANAQVAEVWTTKPTKAGPPAEDSKALNNLGLDLLAERDYKNAAACFKKAYEKAREEKNDRRIGTILKNLEAMTSISSAGTKAYGEVYEAEQQRARQVLDAQRAAQKQIQDKQADIDRKPITVAELDLAGHMYFAPNHGGSLRFRDDVNVEIHSPYSRYDGVSVGILSGTYRIDTRANKLLKTLPPEVIVQYTWGGAQQMVSYDAMRNNGRIVLYASGNCKPLPDWVEQVR